jgi:esterase
MKLFFEKLGQGPTLFILHGFLGMSDNWHIIGVKLSEKFTVYLIDARNHGRSPHSDDFGYKEMVDDLLELIKQEHINRLSIIGHSMGGKTAMLLACQNPALIDKLIVADISPARIMPDDDQIDLLNVISTFEPANYRSLSELEIVLKPRLKSEHLQAFILKNIKRSSEGIFSWKPNIPVLLAHANKIVQSIESNLSFSGPALFIKGELSDYLPASDLPVIEKHFPNYILQELKGARHWVQADKPEEFLKVVFDFLSL